MEVTLLETQGLPDGCLLSIRAGTTRRQAVADPSKFMFRVPKAQVTSDPFKVDALLPVGNAVLNMESGVERYDVQFPGTSSMVSLLIREAKNVDSDTITQSAEKLDAGGTARRHRLAVSAKAYLDRHGLLRFWQVLFQELVRDQPDDPWSYIDVRMDKARAQDPEVPSGWDTRLPEEAEAECKRRSWSDGRPHSAGRPGATWDEEVTVPPAMGANLTGSGLTGVGTFQSPNTPPEEEEGQEVLTRRSYCVPQEGEEEEADAREAAAAAAAEATAMPPDDDEDVDTQDISALRAMLEQELVTAPEPSGEATMMPARPEPKPELEELREHCRQALAKSSLDGSLASTLEKIQTLRASPWGATIAEDEVQGLMPEPPEGLVPDPLEGIRLQIQSTLKQAVTAGTLEATLSLARSTMRGRQDEPGESSSVQDGYFSAGDTGEGECSLDVEVLRERCLAHLARATADGSLEAIMRETCGQRDRAATNPELPSTSGDSAASSPPHVEPAKLRVLRQEAMVLLRQASMEGKLSAALGLRLAAREVREVAEHTPSEAGDPEDAADSARSTDTESIKEQLKATLTRAVEDGTLSVALSDHQHEQPELLETPGERSEPPEVPESAAKQEGDDEIHDWHVGLRKSQVPLEAVRLEARDVLLQSSADGSLATTLLRTLYHRLSSAGSLEARASNIFKEAETIEAARLQARSALNVLLGHHDGDDESDEEERQRDEDEATLVSEGAEEGVVPEDPAMQEAVRSFVRNVVFTVASRTQRPARPAAATRQPTMTVIPEEAPSEAVSEHSQTTHEAPAHSEAPDVEEAASEMSAEEALGDVAGEEHAPPGEDPLVELSDEQDSAGVVVQELPAHEELQAAESEQSGGELVENLAVEVPVASEPPVVEETTDREPLEQCSSGEQPGADPLALDGATLQGADPTPADSLGPDSPGPELPAAQPPAEEASADQTSPGTGALAEGAPLLEPHPEQLPATADAMAQGGSPDSTPADPQAAEAAANEGPTEAAASAGPTDAASIEPAAEESGDLHADVAVSEVPATPEATVEPAPVAEAVSTGGSPAAAAVVEEEAPPAAPAAPVSVSQEQPATALVPAVPEVPAPPPPPVVSSTSASSSKPAIALPVKSAIMVMLRIDNVDYARLIANATLLGELEKAVRIAVALEAGAGVRPEHVRLALSAGSVVVRATVVPPPGGAIDSARAALQASAASAALGSGVLAKVAAINGIEEVATGSIGVSGVVLQVADVFEPEPDALSGLRGQVWQELEGLLQHAREARRELEELREKAREVRPVELAVPTARPTTASSMALQELESNPAFGLLDLEARIRERNERFRRENEALRRENERLKGLQRHTDAAPHRGAHAGQARQEDLRRRYRGLVGPDGK